ncbi:MAG TPA: hypothetical protein VGW11_06685 [Solirubrobacteraceae bacterium]|nr:hypothetical protein [Solirubrobacteraceae bacterium]
MYVALTPPSADLAAQAYRAGLFERAGYVAWDNGWFAGHPTLPYSLLSPPLMAWLGVHLTGALAAVSGAAAFERLVSGAGRGGRIAAVAFAAVVGAHLWTGRVTFLLGFALGLAAVLATVRGRGLPTLALCVLTAAASPVAGLFAAVAGAGLGCAALRRGRSPAAVLALLAGVGVPAVALLVLFPQPGTEPFVASAFWPALAAAAAVAVLVPREAHALRAGAVVYALLLVAAFAVPNGLGGNATRLGALVAGPALVAAAWDHRRWVVLALAPAFAYWALYPPIRDWERAAGDPAVQASFHAPLVDFLRAQGGEEPFRVEVVPTADHGEARWVAPHVPMARGWLRQLDRAEGGLFYRQRLDPGAYRRWLADRAVRFVALPRGAPIDEGGRSEAALLRADPPDWLRPVWRTEDWVVWEVRDPGAFVRGDLAGVAVAPDRVTLRSPGPGAAATLAVRWTPHWAVIRGTGCVRRAPGGWTRVEARAAGPLVLGIAVSPGRARATGPRCTHDK